MTKLLLTPRMHGVLDYTAAMGSVILPFFLDLSDHSLFAAWLSAAVGTGLVIYSLLTDYEFSISKSIPFRVHLGLDLAVAATFFAAPLVFGWQGLAAAYYFVMSATIVVVVVLTQANTTRPPE